MAPTRNGTPERSALPGSCGVLVYHRISAPSSDVHGLSVTLDQFRAHVEYVARCYRPVTLADLAAHVAAGDVPPRSLALTFDDGYLDNLTVASPVLCDHGIPATFFVTTRDLTRRGSYWWDELELMLMDAHAPLDLLPKALAEVVGPAAASYPIDRRRAHDAIHSALLVASIEQRDYYMALLRSVLSTGNESIAERMDAADIIDLASRPGHTIGAHTVNHLMLPRQTLEVQLREIEACRDELQRLGCGPVTSLAYPYGACDQNTEDVAERVGMALAFTCEAPPAAFSMSRLRWPRLQVTPERARTFESWLGAALDGS